MRDTKGNTYVPMKAIRQARKTISRALAVQAKRIDPANDEIKLLS